MTSTTLPWQARLPFYYGWIIVGLGFASAFFGIGLVWAAGLFFVPMHEDLGWSRSSYFFAVSLRGWVGIVVTPLMGSFLDRKSGPRLLMLAGGVLNSIALGLITFVDSEWQFQVLFGIVGGIAQTVQGGLSVAIVPKWFIRRRGFAVSVSTTGGGLAAFFMPAIIASLSAGLGWRYSWMALGIMSFLFTAIPVALLRRQPEDVGLLPDGDKQPAAGEARAPRPAEAYSFTLAEALHTRTFWILMVGVSVGAMSNNGIPANMAAIFVDRGFDFGTAGLALTAYGVGSVLTKFVLGWVANRMHIRTLLLLLTAYGMIVTPSLLVLPSDFGSLALGYGFLIGLFVGAYVPFHQMVWSVYFGRGHVGSISGVARPLGIILISGSPFMLAFLRDTFGSYDVGIMVTAASAAVCFVCLLFVRAPRQPAEPAPAPAPVQASA